MKSGLPGPLVLSVLVHVVVLAALGQVGLHPSKAAVGSYTRIRLTKWDSASVSGQVPRISLPGGKARAVALPAPASDPGAEEMRRQLERIAAMRDEFFRPMSVATLPMPVIPGLPSRVPAPPLWDVPLTGRLEGLPPLPGGPQAAAELRRLAELLRGGSRHPGAAPAPAGQGQRSGNRPGAPARQEPGSVVVSVPDERVAETPPSHTEAAPVEGTRVAQAEPATGGPSEPPAAKSDPVSSGEGEAGAREPVAPAPEATAQPSSSDAVPVSATEADRPAEPPSDVVAAAGDAAPPSTGIRLEAPAQDAAAPDPAVERPDPRGTSEGSASEAAATPAPAEEPSARDEGAVPGKAAPAPAIPKGGAHAGLSGSFRVPLGLALPGFHSSLALSALLKEMGTRTALKVASLGLISPESLPDGAPLLYLKGSGTFSLNEEQRAALAGYVRGGGTLLVDGCDGGFGESVRAELGRILPGQAPVRVPAGDPLYSAFYRLAGAPGVRLFPLQAIRVEGRPAVILSPAFLGRRWQQTSDPEHEAAVALGVNILLSAAAGRK